MLIASLLSLFCRFFQAVSNARINPRRALSIQEEETKQR
jgi:hypothetical protein